MKRTVRSVVVTAGFALGLGACAELPFDLGVLTPGLTESEIAAGLREALEVGAGRAAGRLGRSDGYWGSDRFRVPLPDMLERAARYLRSTGQGTRVDQFHLTLNRAAEQAAQKAAPVFGDAIRRMTLADARAILEGPTDAATAFFERTTRERLAQEFLPVVSQATSATGATRQYKQLVEKAGPLGEFLGKDLRDIDAYVTDRALDGLFKALAEEEQKIRQDPAARTTELLRRIFGA